MNHKHITFRIESDEIIEKLKNKLGLNSTGETIRAALEIALQQKAKVKICSACKGRGYLRK